MNNEELNRILKDWAAQNACAPEQVDRLAKQISQETRRLRYENRFADVWSEPLSVWKKLRYVAVGAVLAVVVAVLILRMPPPSAQNAGEDADAEVIGMAGISANQLQSCTKLYHEIKRLFPDGLRWIAQSDGEVGIGMETSSDAASAKATPMIVKVSVLSRKTGDNAWRQIWSTELIMNDQDMVEVVPDRQTDNKLALWVYPLEDGKLAVDSSVSLHLPITVESRLNAVVTPGQPTQMALLKLDGIEYGIFQTVDLMKGKI